jgi:hypothetical protein
VRSLYLLGLLLGFLVEVVLAFLNAHALFTALHPKPLNLVAMILCSLAALFILVVAIRQVDR